MCVADGRNECSGKQEKNSLPLCNWRLKEKEDKRGLVMKAEMRKQCNVVSVCQLANQIKEKQVMDDEELRRVNG